MRRIDAHQHFWLYNEKDYVWMGPPHEPIRRDFTPDHLAPLLDELDFQGSVAVQARQMVEETVWLLDLADKHSSILGVVGWVDLGSPNVGDQIERFSSHGRLKGVRHVIHDEPDDGFMLGADFRRGLSLLEDAGLTYDLLLFPRHLTPAVQLVDMFPTQPFVLDHIAKPRIADGVLSPWNKDIRELARRENVTCKLSGMVTEAGHKNWKAADFSPYLDTVLEAFGPDRLMLGSDWPVCTLEGDYVAVMKIVLDYMQALSASEQQAITGGTCARFYGI